MNIYKQIKKKDFVLDDNESYIFLMIEKISKSNDEEDQRKFPSCLQNLLESIDNLTTRGKCQAFSFGTLKNFSYKLFQLNGEKSLKIV